MRQAQQQARAYAKTMRSREWVDKLGNTSQQIREGEKTGKAYMSEREWGQMTSKAKQRIQKESDDRIRKKIEFAASEIKKGRRYTQEWGSRLKELKEKH
jgi:hypothetical protein